MSKPTAALLAELAPSALAGIIAAQMLELESEGLTVVVFLVVTLVGFAGTRWIRKPKESTDERDQDA